MPTINSALVPTVAPGNLFATLTGDTTLNVRWYTPTDPVFYEVLNRPVADIVLRQLILAKTLDQLSINIGHEAIFPFLVQPQLAGSGTNNNVDIPAGWIWDLHFSTPAEWNNFRLSQIKRMSGTTTIQTGSTGSCPSSETTSTGVLRLIFTANRGITTVETAIFMADYQIDSTLTYQRAALVVATTTDYLTAIPSGESLTVTGYITFRTLPQSNPLVQEFYGALLPPVSGTTSGTYDYYTTPTIYQLAGVLAAGLPGVVADFSVSGMAHGTGLLVDSCYNALPQLDSDVQAWIECFNYPYDVTASREAVDSTGVVIPIGLFREFNITAPAGDQPTGDSSGLFYPVWVSRIEPVGTVGTTLRFYFATYNITDATPSLDYIEFATLDLQATMYAGQIVAIVPSENLLLQTSTDSALYLQHLGRGHVVLSDVWTSTTTIIEDFFNQFAALTSGTAFGVVGVTFSQATTRIGAFAISRVPKYTPTAGQAQALVGTTSTLTTPMPPSEDNRFVVEQDQGIGNTVDFGANTSLSPTAGVSRYGYTGSLCHRIVNLCIDYTQLPTGSSPGAGTFYDTVILPRLIILLGRAPQFGDQWFNGTNLLFMNGDSWQSP